VLTPVKLDLRSKRSEGWAIFERGARDALLYFDIFETAVTEQWGGSRSRDKFDRIVDDLVMNCREQWDLSNDLHVDTLDVFLIECLETDFGVDFDEETESDRIITICSLAIQDLYRKCASFNFEEARTLLDGLAAVARRRQGLAPRPRVDSSSDDEDDDEEDGGMVETREAGDESRRSGAAGGGGGRVVDSDGWETVPVRKGGRGGGAGVSGSSNQNNESRTSGNDEKMDESDNTTRKT